MDGARLKLLAAWIDALYRGADAPVRDSDRLRLIADRFDEIDNAAATFANHEPDRAWQADLRRIADRLDSGHA